MVVTHTGSATGDLAAQYKFSTYTLSSMTADFGGAGAQTVDAASAVGSYGALVTAGTGTKTLGGAVTDNGPLTIGSGTTLDVSGSNFSLSVGGNWTNNGTFTPRSGAVTFDGLTAQTINSATNFAGLTINNSTGVILGTTNTAYTIAGTLTFTSGNITTGSNWVQIPSGGAVSQSSGYVLGNLERYIPTGTNVAAAFAVGTTNNSSNDYTPITVTFSNVTSAGYLFATSSAGNNASIGTSLLDPTHSVDVSYALSLPSTGAAAFSGTYSAVFGFNASDLGSGTNTSNLVVGKLDTGTWTYPTVGTQGSTSTQATGMTSIGQVGSPSNFQLAQFTPLSTSTAISDNVSGSTTYGTSVTFTATVTNTSGVNMTPSGTVAFYDGATLLGAGTALTGSGNTATSTITLSTLAASNVTAHSITAVFTPSGNFVTSTSPADNIVIADRSLTISGVTASNKTYDGTTSDTLNTSGDSLVGVVSGDASNVTLSNSGATGTFASVNVGTSIGVTASGFSITGSAAGDYSLSQPTGLSANITPATLTISGVTASDKTYDGTTSDTLNTSGDSLVGVVSGDTANVTLSNSGASCTFASANAGTDIGVTASGFTISGTAAGNYSLTQPAGLTANITTSR